MKTETLISQILPASKNEEKSKRTPDFSRDLDRTKGPKVAFADLLKPKAMAAPQPAPAKKAQPRPDSRPERKPVAEQERQQSPERNNVDKPSREELLRRFEEKKRAKQIETRQTEAKEASKRSNSNESNETQSAVTTSSNSQKTSESQNENADGNKKNKIDSQTGQKIKKILGDQQQMAQDIPAVAILTGQLEHVEPKSIPMVVSRNEFLQDAFGAEEVQSFLSKPNSLGQILTKIGVSDTDIQNLAQSGVDVAAFVSPAELFNTLGLDVQRLGSEIKILKDNISVSNGLSSYIARAEKLQQKAPTKIDMTNGKAIEKEFEDGNSDSSIALGTIQESNQQTLAQQAPIQQPHAPIPNGHVKHSNSETSLYGMISENGESSENNINAVNAPVVDAASDFQAPTQPLNQAKTDPVTQLQSMMPNNQVADIQAPNSQTTIAMAEQVDVPAVQSDLEKLPQSEMVSVEDLEYALKTKNGDNSLLKNVEKATKPVFNSFGEGINLDKIDLTQTAEAANEEATPSSEEFSFGSQKPEFTQQKMTSSEKPGISPLKVAQNPDNASPIENGFTNNYESDFSTLGETKMGQSEMNPNQKLAQNLIAANIQKNPRIRESMRQNTLERLAVTGTAQAAGQKQSSDQAQNQNFSGGGKDSGSGATQDQLGTLGLAKTNQAQVKNDKGFESLMKLEAPNQVTSKVIERARMMVKDGGGEVIIDLGSEELGKVELAMNVKNNKVELKILAASEQVRELLSQDIGTLRESLAIQELNLSEVEVGVGEDQSRQSLMSDSQDQTSDQNQHSQGQTNDKQTQSLTSKRPPIRRSAHQGQIQVQA